MNEMERIDLSSARQIDAKRKDCKVEVIRSEKKPTHLMKVGMPTAKPLAITIKGNQFPKKTSIETGQTGPSSKSVMQRPLTTSKEIPLAEPNREEELIAASRSK